MILFPMYAAIVLYAIYSRRRQFLGLAVLAASLLGLALLAWIDVTVGRWITGRPPMPLFRLLLCVEAGILLPLGMYLWTVRREKVEVPCRKCEYELHGLEVANPTCPECGLPFAASEVPSPLTTVAPTPVAGGQLRSWSPDAAAPAA